MDNRTAAVKKYISKELWMRARAAALTRCVTITEWLSEAIKNQIKKEKNHGE